MVEAILLVITPSAVTALYDSTGQFLYAILVFIVLSGVSALLAIAMKVIDIRKFKKLDVK